MINIKDGRKTEKYRILMINGINKLQIINDLKIKYCI